ncbi:MAG: hypothetical protein R3B40_19870 [Polyangiales bacterium]
MSRYTFRTLHAHTRPVTSLHVHGARLLSTSMDGTACVYDVAGRDASLAPRVQLAHDEPVDTGALSATHIATAHGAGSVSVWGVEGGEHIRRLEGHSAPVTFVSWWGDALLSASRDGTIRRWDVDTGVCLESIRGFSGRTAVLAAARGVLYFAEGPDLVALDLETQARRVFASQDRDDLMAFGVCSGQVVVSYAEVSNSPSPPFRWSQAFDACTGEPLRDRYEAADMFAFSADGRRALFLLWGSVALVEDGQRQDVLEAVVPDPRCAVFLEPSGIVLGGASGALYCGSHVAG